MKQHHHRSQKRGRHRTACKTLRRGLARLEARPEVERVVLDAALPFRHQRTPGTLEVAAVLNGGVKLKAYDSLGMRWVFVKTPAPRALVKWLATAA